MGNWDDIFPYAKKTRMFDLKIKLAFGAIILFIFVLNLLFPEDVEYFMNQVDSFKDVINHWGD